MCMCVWYNVCMGVLITVCDGTQIILKDVIYQIMNMLQKWLIARVYDMDNINNVLDALDV